MSEFVIDHIVPRAGIRGGAVEVYAAGITVSGMATCRLLFGSQAIRPTLVTPTFVLGTVPEAPTSNTVQIEQCGRCSNAVAFTSATVLAENLHPVANPAIDRSGAIYTTISGSKGQQVPVSIYRVSRSGEVEAFASGIMNPTGLAFGPDGGLYVSSRHEGKLYRVNEQGRVAPFAENLGVPTGLTFDFRGRLWVGERRGSIYQVSDTGQPRLVAKLTPSVASYHLAYGDDDRLYVSYPTLSGDDRVYRIAPDGEVDIVARGLGRAQGLAFDIEGNLYVVAYTQGRGGVIRLTPGGDLCRVVAGINLVGVAFSADGALIVADNRALYRLELGIQGRLLP
jgi:sugar lactone lactonase YvrE